MKNHDLQTFTNMINAGGKCSFLLKDVRVQRAKRSIASIGEVRPKVRVFVEIEHDGQITRWDAEAGEFQVLDGNMQEI